MGTFLMYMKKKKSYNSAPEKQEVTEESVAKEPPKESMPEPIPMENATAAIPEPPVADLNPVIDNEETDSIIEIHTEKEDSPILALSNTEEQSQNVTQESKFDTVVEKSPDVPSLPITDSETPISCPQSSNNTFFFGIYQYAKSFYSETTRCILSILSNEKEKYQNSKDVLYFEIVSDEEVSLVGYSGSPHEIDIPVFVEFYGKTYIVTSIGPKAFSNCVTLATVTIPESIQHIGEKAFYGCVLMEVYISKNASYTAGDYAFGGNSMAKFYRF